MFERRKQKPLTSGERDNTIIVVGIITIDAILWGGIFTLLVSHIPVPDGIIITAAAPLTGLIGYLTRTPALGTHTTVQGAGEANEVALTVSGEGGAAEGVAGNASGDAEGSSGAPDATGATEKEKDTT